MNTIATLGPQGTFSDLATGRFLEQAPGRYEVRHYDSIKLALNAIGTECEVGVVPIENLSEGFIPVVLDTLAKRELFVLQEIILAVRFSFVSNAGDISAIKKVFAQFVAKGQCSEFLSTLGGHQGVTTQSNIESLELLKSASASAGAIVPSHAVSRDQFSIVIENVHDFEHNQTRFVAISSMPPAFDGEPRGRFKTSVVVFGENDYPGLLGNVLSSFSRRAINITSLVSRPNGAQFGQYNFFIDAEGHQAFPELSAAIQEIATHCPIKVLGSYRVAQP
jgi:prephenate dehydratase